MNEKRKSLIFPEYTEKYYNEHGWKLPDDALNSGNKKWGDIFQRENRTGNITIHH